MAIICLCCPSVEWHGLMCNGESRRWRAHAGWMARWILSAYHCGQWVSEGIMCVLVLTMVIYEGDTRCAFQRLIIYSNGWCEEYYYMDRYLTKLGR